MHLSLMSSVVTKQQHQITSLKSAISKLSLNYTGTLIWKISDYAAKMTEAKSKEGMELISPPFYTSQYGYKLQVIKNKYMELNFEITHLLIIEFGIIRFETFSTSKLSNFKAPMRNFD